MTIVKWVEEGLCSGCSEGGGEPGAMVVVVVIDPCAAQTVVGEYWIGICGLLMFQENMPNRRAMLGIINRSPATMFTP